MSIGSAHRLELRVGALILAGILAVVMIILVSDRISFAGDYQITAYLKDAGGLHSGSPVTLSGLPIGKVTSISSDSGKTDFPVKVVMEVRNTYRLPRSVHLALATSGIFGDAYLAFTGSGVPANPDDLLPLDGRAEVYASPGFFDAASEQAMDLLANLNDVLSTEARVDTKRLLKNAADLAGESAALVKSLHSQTQRIDRTFAHLEALSGSLVEASERLVPRVEAALERIEHLGAQGSAVVASGAGAMAKVDTILARGDRLLADSEGDLRAIVSDLRQALADTAALLAATRQGRGVVGQLLASQELAKDVSDLTLNLVQVSELVLEHPEALIFGQSNEQRQSWLQRRDRLRMRRAFQEGWHRAPEPALKAPTLLESGREHAAP